SYANLLGEEHGQKNQPVTPAQMQALILNKIEVTIQEGIDDNKRRHLLDSGIAVARKILSDAKDKIMKLDAAIFDIRHKLPRLVQLKEQLKPNLEKAKWRKYMYIYIGASIIAITEGFFSYEAFRNANVPILASFFMAAGIAVAVGFGVHILAGWIRKAKTRAQRIFRYCVVLIPAFIGFATLGNLRADAYSNVINLQVNPEQMVDTSGGTVSGWAIAIISFLLFLAALLFSLKYGKTEQEEKQEQDYKETCNEIDTLEQEIERMEAEKVRINEGATANAALALARYEYAGSNETILATAGRQAFEIYKDKNIRYRNNVPEFFSYPPSFNFTFYFKSLKEKAYETSNTTSDAAYVD
ncbi:MAG: hypothetical protein K8F30_07475, partial [Taibaiella sp.]|nr:hypothetical protein [Taibaiella sp.]